PRRGRHGANGARRGVEHDRGRALRVPLRDRVAQHRLRVCLDRMVEREVDVAPVALRLGDDRVDRLARGVLDDALATGPPGELLVERELEAGQAVVVDARVPDQLRGERELRVEAALLRIEPEARQTPFLELRRLRRVGLALDVDEAVRPVGQLLVDLVRVELQRLRDRRGLGLRVRHLARVGVHRLRLLADRELEPRAVVDRPARGRDHDILAVLARGEPAERGGTHALKPGRAQEGEPEGEHEDAEEQPDATVRRLGAQRECGLSRTYVVSAGFAGTSPNCFWACSWMRGEAAVMASCEASACFSARRCARCVSSLSSWTFRRSTATLSATTPASRTATIAIQTTPPATPRRACGR